MNFLEAKLGTWENSNFIYYSNKTFFIPFSFQRMKTQADEFVSCVVVTFNVPI